MYKYILAAVLSFAVATPALADPKHHDYYRSHNHHNHKGSGKWVAPLIGGIVLGAIISDAKAKERENNRKIIVVKEPQKHCEELTIIVQNRWGDILERRTEYRCTEY
jgi:hypothetical protein